MKTNRVIFIIEMVCKWALVISLAISGVITICQHDISTGFVFILIALYIAANCKIIQDEY